MAREIWVVELDGKPIDYIIPQKGESVKDLQRAMKSGYRVVRYIPAEQKERNG